MPNYYEILKCTSSASPAEIETCIETSYNQVRRLVNHHDQKVVNQANQALALLEEMRATLLDSTRRAAYDASLGMEASSLLGGLADLDSAPNAAGAQPSGPGAAPLPFLNVAAQPAGGAVPPAVKPPPGAPPGTLPGVSTAWVCPKCHAANPAESLFCKTCGETLAVTCPQCSHIVEAWAQFCPTCGTRIEVALHRKDLQTQINATQQSLNQVTAQDPRRDTEIASLRDGLMTGLTWLLIALLAAMQLLALIPSAALKSSLTWWGVQVVATIIFAIASKSRAGKVFGPSFSGLLLLATFSGVLYGVQNMLGAPFQQAIALAQFCTGIIFFFLFLGIGGRLRQVLDILKVYHPSLRWLRGISSWISLLLIPQPVLLAWYGYSEISSDMSLNWLLQFSSIAHTLTLAALSLFSLFFVVAILICLRLINSITTQVRSALEMQRQQSETLQGKLTGLVRELESLP
jgi:hypothetical protein